FLAKWGSSGSDDGQFDGPEGVAVDNEGNVYVADTGNNRIQKFNSSGIFLTRWGSSGSGDGQFDSPEGVAVDSDGNVYIAEVSSDFEDSNDRIQKFRYLQHFTPTPTITATPTVTPTPTITAAPTATVTPMPTSTQQSRSSGSISSGGGGTSGENYSNILLIEKYDLEISKDVLTFYRFTDTKNPIISINITGNTNLGIITTSVEVLKNNSSLVNTSPDGLVYKNVNIWVGTSGFASPKNIKEAVIMFRVENSWISDNDLKNSDINLQRWNGSQWISLSTSENANDSTYTYFVANTNSFSPFAITSLKETLELMEIILPPEETPGERSERPDGNKSESNKSSIVLNWFIISGIFVVIGLIIEVLKMKRK
ncbi:MAG: PGF-pre-PGF domain-containing protein, partial [Candidatus Methanoperedens sp.]|nr:PGF-pre-PGF domain-containing protein [Candidatus Methanoperedens sp.]